MKKGKTLKIILIIIIFVIIVGAGISIYLVKSEENKTTENNLTTTNSSNSTEVTKESVDATKEVAKTYKIEDYVKIEDKTIETTPVSKVKYVTLTNIPEGIRVNFDKNQNNFLSSSMISEEDRNFKFSNEVSSEIKDNILSVYVVETSLPKEGPFQKFNGYSINVDLSKNKLILNEEMLNSFKVDKEEMFSKILTNISENVTTDNFLMSTTGYIMAEKVTVLDFKNKINTYAQTISNRSDIITLYIKDGKLNVAFKQIDILNALGMCTYMESGLKNDPQSVIIK